MEKEIQNILEEMQKNLEVVDEYSRKNKYDEEDEREIANSIFDMEFNIKALKDKL